MMGDCPCSPLEMTSSLRHGLVCPWSFMVWFASYLRKKGVYEIGLVRTWWLHFWSSRKNHILDLLLSFLILDLCSLLWPFVLTHSKDSGSVIRIPKISSLFILYTYGKDREYNTLLNVSSSKNQNFFQTWSGTISS